MIRKNNIVFYIVLLLVLGSCRDTKTFGKTYQVTCWSCDTIILDEKLVNTFDGWKRMNGEYAPTITGGGVCTYKSIDGEGSGP